MCLFCVDELLIVLFTPLCSSITLMITVNQSFHMQMDSGCCCCGECRLQLCFQDGLAVRVYMLCFYLWNCTWSHSWLCFQSVDVLLANEKKKKPPRTVASASRPCLSASCSSAGVGFKTRGEPQMHIETLTLLIMHMRFSLEVSTSPADLLRWQWDCKQVCCCDLTESDLQTPDGVQTIWDSVWRPMWSESPRETRFPPSVPNPDPPGLRPPVC